MIERLLPGEVAAAEMRGDPPEARLLPGELELVVHAAESRRREFRTVRHCARLALARLGLPPAPILRGARGAPLWPPAVVGSLTHAAGYRAAAVARARDVAALGIDADAHEPLPDRAVARIALPGERARLAVLARRYGRVHWDAVLFSAKESIFKAWYPLTGYPLGFADAEVTIDLGYRFHARLRHPASAELDGRWLVADGLVYTAVIVPAGRIRGGTAAR